MRAGAAALLDALTGLSVTALLAQGLAAGLGDVEHIGALAGSVALAVTGVFLGRSAIGRRSSGASSWLVRGAVGALCLLAGGAWLFAVRAAAPGHFPWPEPVLAPLAAFALLTMPGVFAASFGLRRAAQRDASWMSLGSAVGVGLLLVTVVIGLFAAGVVLMIISPSHPRDPRTVRGTAVEQSSPL